MTDGVKQEIGIHPSMELAVLTPPICKLHEDILLYIFELNILRPETELFPQEEHNSALWRLNIARYASQVCHAWRNTILRSPFIWAKIINMNMVATSDGAQIWAQEVVKRTMNVPLSVHGVVQRTRQSQAFFKDLVINQWHRICELDVEIMDYLDNEPIDEEVWSMLWRPAPILERFTLKRSTSLLSTEAVWATKTGPMFANSAPLLRQFCCSVIDHEAIWISQLSRVILSGPLTALDVLKILSKAGRLESLIIRHTDSHPKADKWMMQIHLPNLRLLEIKGNTLQQSLIYLRNIIAKPSCRLVLRTRQWRDQGDITAQQMSLFCRAISRYANNHLEHNTPARMVVDVEGVVRRGVSQGPKIYVHLPVVDFRHPTLELDLDPNDSQNIKPPVVPSLHPVFSAFSTIHLSCITELELLNNTPSWVDSNNPDLIQFLSSLQSVKTLTMTLSTVKILCSATLHRPIVLPSLHHIKLITSEKDAGASPGFLPLFLSRRKAAQVPIFTLDISEQPIYKYPRYMLDGFEDLVITLIGRTDSHL